MNRDPINRPDQYGQGDDPFPPARGVINPTTSRLTAERDELRNELSARADDHAFLDALRAFLADDWSAARQIHRRLAEALGVDPARVDLDIDKTEIRFAIRADGQGGERWDDYARARAEQIDPAPLAERLDARWPEQAPIVSPPAVRQAADQFAPRTPPDCDCKNTLHHGGAR